LKNFLFRIYNTIFWGISAIREVVIPASAARGINYSRYPSSQLEWIPVYPDPALTKVGE
jgi:hypothetical protein